LNTMLPEAISAWKSLEGQVVDGKLHLEVLESHERVPVFAATLEGRPVTVRFFHEPDGSTSIFDRHREAAFFSHPNLLPCLGTGSVTLQDERFTYGVYESPNILLSTILEGKSFSPEETKSLCLDILDGLDYLHERGLVYCNLDRSSVARCGDRWKLCDYSELRPEGSGYGPDTRRLLGALPGAPPEAYSGVVSPAWDCWSLAHLFRSLAAEASPARHPDGTPTRPPRPPELPEPFRTVAAGCLLPDPGGRCTTADIRRQLEAVAPVITQQTYHAPPPPPTPTDEEPWRTAYDRIPETRRRRITPAAILVGAATAIGLLFGVSAYLSSRQAVRQPAPAAANAPATSSHDGTEPTRSRVDPAPRKGSPASRQSEVSHVVQQWADAFRSKDLNAEISLYAPRVRRFYLSNNVTADFVRRTKESALKSAGEVRRYELQNVNTRFSGRDEATVTFDKVWDFSGGTRNTGKVRGELKLQRQNGAWRIVSERDLQVYRQSRTRA
jgi:serine/threonine protein kinase